MTTNRREFLQIGVSATAWPLVARTMQATGIEPLPERVTPSLVPLSLVIYDTRFPESIAFAERCAALGLRTRAIEADMTRLWYDEIYHQWRAGAQPIAGLTAHGPMFCFAELARDVRMRVVFRAEHQLGRGGLLAHSVNGPETMVSEAIGACAGERSSGLGAAMAGVVTRCPVGRTEITSARAGIERRPTDEDALYTWMIAPAIRG